jgi:hypothetical protein
VKAGSARIVIEVDPDLKRQLYSALAIESSTLKEWFVRAAQQYIADRRQPRLPEITTNNRDDRKRR